MLELAERTARAVEKPLLRSRMSLADKTSFIDKHGMDEFLALPWD